MLNSVNFCKLEKELEATLCRFLLDQYTDNAIANHFLEFISVGSFNLTMKIIEIK